MFNPVPIVRGIIPALAGNTQPYRYRRPRRPDHPRSRGEYLSKAQSYKSVSGSSPLSRGILIHQKIKTSVFGIIPALAGNTLRRRRPGGKEKDHPRSRGEYNHRVFHHAPRTGSSPLSRGIRLLVFILIRQLRIIPALAGNTRPFSSSDQPRTDHPRSRGEYIAGPFGIIISEGSSPLSRGILVHGPVFHRRQRIIPALAGNTTAWLGINIKRQDHPRSRGEYSPLLPLTRNSVGSSPLSRGILNRHLGVGESLRIIPALAGNTQSPRP